MNKGDNQSYETVYEIITINKHKRLFTQILIYCSAGIKILDIKHLKKQKCNILLHRIVLCFNIYSSNQRRNMNFHFFKLIFSAFSVYDM